MPKPDSDVEHFRLAHPSEFCILRKRFSLTTVSSLGHALAISGDARVRTDGKRRVGPGIGAVLLGEFVQSQLQEPKVKVLRVTSKFGRR